MGADGTIARISTEKQVLYNEMQLVINESDKQKFTIAELQRKLSDAQAKVEQDLEKNLAFYKNQIKELRNNVSAGEDKLNEEKKANQKYLATIEKLEMQKKELEN